MNSSLSQDVIAILAEMRHFKHICTCVSYILLHPCVFKLVALCSLKCAGVSPNLLCCSLSMAHSRSPCDTYPSLWQLSESLTLPRVCSQVTYSVRSKFGNHPWPVLLSPLSLPCYHSTYCFLIHDAVCSFITFCVTEASLSQPS